jgi:DNA (cytosine-5)-methyltransferase 1
MNALSLFANVGVAETYLSDIGCDVVVANELEEARARFYSHLYPSCNMICGDITDKKVYDKVIKSAKEARVEFILATPPCQGMSIAGHNSPYDERNSLVKYAVDAIVDLLPKYVFMENVPQQLDTPINYHGEEILIPEYLKQRLGNKYRFNKEMITNTMYYGVPQMRRRSVILLVRKDIDFLWEFPEPEKEIVTLSKAFAEIPDLWPEIQEKDFRNKLPENTLEALSFHKWHKPPKHVWRNVECMLHTSTGNTAFDNPFYYPKKTNGEKVKGYAECFSPHSTSHSWVGITKLFCSKLKVGTVWHSMAHLTCGIIIIAKSRIKTSLMGAIPWGFSYVRKGGGYAKETKETVPLSRLPEPYGRRLL